MKRFGISFVAVVITTVMFSDGVLAQSSSAFGEIAAKYKACIMSELEAASNDDGTYDEVFFLEGKVHCDKMKELRVDTAASKTRIAQMTADLISGAKRELGLK